MNMTAAQHQKELDDAAELEARQEEVSEILFESYMAGHKGLTDYIDAWLATDAEYCERVANMAREMSYAGRADVRWFDEMVGEQCDKIVKGKTNEELDKLVSTYA